MKIINQGKKILVFGKNIIIVSLLVCLAGNVFASDKTDDYREEAKAKIVKIMKSEATLDKKLITLKEKALQLANKRKLNEKQKVELREIYYFIAKSYYAVLKNYKSAAVYFDKAIKIEDCGVLELYKGNSLVCSKEYAKAIEAYKRALMFRDLPKENIPNLFLMMGYAEYHIGDYGAAENAFKKAISLDSKQKGQAERYVVTCLQQLGKYDEALMWLDSMNSVKKNEEFVLRKKAKIFCQMGHYDECAKAIDELEDSYPLDEELNILKAQLSFAQGDFENVTKQIDLEFSKPGRKTTYDYECYIMRAQIALQEGEHRKALDFVDKAVRVPMPPYGIKLRGDIYLAMGDKAKALEYYREFLKVSPSIALNKHVEEVVTNIQNDLLEQSNYSKDE